MSAPCIYCAFWRSTDQSADVLAGRCFVRAPSHAHQNAPTSAPCHATRPQCERFRWADITELLPIERECPCGAPPSVRVEVSKDGDLSAHLCVECGRRFSSVHAWGDSGVAE